MKAGRLLLVLLILSTLFSPALALTKGVTPTRMELLATIPDDVQAQGLLVRGKVVYIFGATLGSANSDGIVRAIDGAGATLWSLPLDLGADEVVTAGAIDPTGHIWLVGAATPSASPAPQPSDSATSTSLNPDAVVMDPTLPLRRDLTSLALWEVDATGALLATFHIDLARPVLARSVLVTSNNVVIVGEVVTTSGNAGFALLGDISGAFGAPVLIGKSDTELRSIVKTAAGFVAAGSSAEKISTKSLIGTRDAIALTLSPSGKVLSLLRSSTAKQSRLWQSATTSLLFAGTLNSTSVIFSKFASTLQPSWSVNYPSAGGAIAVDGPASRFGLFASNSNVAGVKGWKPAKPAVIALAFDSKGSVQAAFSATSLNRPISAGFSTVLGLVVLGQVGQKGSSVFHVVTR